MLHAAKVRPHLSNHLSNEEMRWTVTSKQVAKKFLPHRIRTILVGAVALALATLASGQSAPVAKRAPGTADAPPDFRNFQIEKQPAKAPEPRSLEAAIEGCKKDKACKAKLDQLMPKRKSSLEYLWQQFGIGEAHAQTTYPYIIVYPCQNPQIRGITGARAYWFSHGGFQGHCPWTFAHYLYRHTLGPTGNGPYVQAVIVLQTPGTYLIEAHYLNNNPGCSGPNPTAEPLTTFLEIWDGAQYAPAATWADPCTSGFHDHFIVANLQAGWNYIKLRTKHLPTQPGHAWLSGFTFRLL